MTARGPEPIIRLAMKRTLWIVLPAAVLAVALSCSKEKGTGAVFEITYEKTQYGCDIKEMKASEPGPEDDNAQ